MMVQHTVMHVMSLPCLQMATVFAMTMEKPLFIQDIYQIPSVVWVQPV